VVYTLRKQSSASVLHGKAGDIKAYGIYEWNLDPHPLFCKQILAL